MNYLLPPSLFRMLITFTNHPATLRNFKLRYQLSAVLIPGFILCSCITYAQTKKEIAARGINAVTVHTYDARKKDTTGRKNFSRFDQRGNVLEAIEYDLNGNIKSWEQYEYNQQDDETAYRELMPDGKISKATNSTYDKWHHVTEKITIDSLGILLEKTTYTYNNFNDLLTELTADKEGKIIHQVLYEYDNKGMLLSRKILNEKGQLIYSKEYTYQY